MGEPPCRISNAGSMSKSEWLAVLTVAEDPEYVHVGGLAEEPHGPVHQGTHHAARVRGIDPVVLAVVGAPLQPFQSGRNSVGIGGWWS